MKPWSLRGRLVALGLVTLASVSKAAFAPYFVNECVRAEKPDNPAKGGGGCGGGVPNFCPDGSITYDPSVPPGAQRVDVYRNGQYIVSASNIACALTGTIPADFPIRPGMPIVPDPFDGNYELIVQSGFYNEVMTRSTNGNANRGILINKQTGQFLFTLRAADGADVLLGSAGSEFVNFRISLVSPANNTTIDGLKLSNAYNALGVQPLDSNSDGGNLMNVTISNCEIFSSSVPYEVDRGMFHYGLTDDSNIVLVNNRVHDVERAILFSGRVSGCQMVGNVIYNSDVGIELRGAGPVGWIVRQNTIVNCIDGIHLEAVDDKRSKTVKMPGAMIIENNTIWAIGAGSVCINVDEPNPDVPADGIVIQNSDQNNLFTQSGAVVGLWGNAAATTLADWQSISGHDANSRSEDPCLDAGFPLPGFCP